MLVGINTDDNGNDGNCDDFGNGDDLMIMMVIRTGPQLTESSPVRLVLRVDTRGFGMT